MKTASRIKSKSIFLVFDNADQLPPETQNQIFLIARKLSEILSCYALIALREESYWKNRDSGPLNAFHNTAYHVQPPSLEQILSRRFLYAKSLLGHEGVLIADDKTVSQEDISGVLDSIVKTLLGPDRRYLEFIESLASRDIRRALDNVAAFLVSGHTNLDAVLRGVRSGVEINVPFHEFVDSITLRDYEVYSEGLCEVINLFAVDGTSDASNFNRLAVLGRVLLAQSQKSEVGVGYLLKERLVEDCEALGILPDTTISLISLLNEKRLIETELQIRDSVGNAKYVRATVSGRYYIDSLSKYFEYLDLIVVQTPIKKGRYYDRLARIQAEIDSLSKKDAPTRLKRVEKRLERCEEFLAYLYSQFTQSSIYKKKDLVDPRCGHLIADMQQSIKEQKVAVLGKAREIFEKR